MLVINTPVIQPVDRGPVIPLALNNTNRPIDLLSHWRNTREFRMDEHYQRDYVWGVDRKANLIRSILMGIPIPSLILNWRDWPDDYSIAVVDGKQRISAILNFLDGELVVPGPWFGLDGDVTFNDLPRPTRLRLGNKSIAVSEASLGSLEDEERVFNLINYGGVPQGMTD